MLIYRDAEYSARALELFREFVRSVSVIGSTPSHDDVVACLIRFGQIEAAITDRICAGHDVADDRVRLLRAVSAGLGSLLAASWRGGRDASLTALDRVRAAALQIERYAWPEEVRLKTPEGFAYYGLAPEMYLAAAWDFFDAVKPRSAVSIGIRSIGTSLSGIVAGALQARGCPVASFTLRPRGHPFDRRVALASGLEEQLRALEASHFLVVDEGPGLSGSSFASVASALSRLGIPDERIILFPSWLPDPASFISDAARSSWPRFRKFCAGFEDVWIASGRLFGRGSQLRDLSAGNWRQVVYTSDESIPPVQPLHERRKYLVWGDDGDAVLFKFAGYGDRGVRAFLRATALSESGFIPKVVGLRHGFLISEFERGRPVRGRGAGRDLLDRIAAYLGFVARNFQAEGEGGRWEDLEAMLATNVREGLGEAWLERLGRVERFRALTRDSAPLWLDGRMFPCEWLHDGSRYVKTDAIDHHDDHFYPGPQDLAWDLAGTTLEFGLTPAAEQYLISSTGRQAGTRIDQARYRVYRLAYLAFRFGYCSLAASTLHGSDAVGFRKLARRCGAHLEREIAGMEIFPEIR